MGLETLKICRDKDGVQVASGWTLLPNALANEGSIFMLFCHDHAGMSLIDMRADTFMRMRIIII